MARILVITERARGALDDSAWELLTAARALADGGPVAAVLCGDDAGGLADELAHGFDDVYLFEDPRLALPDAESDGHALRALLERETFDAILAPHTNNTLDLLPALATRLELPLLADCEELEWRDGRLAAVRAVYGGKIKARVIAAASERGVMASVRGGAFEATAPGAAASGSVHAETLSADLVLRRRPLRTLEPEASDVDISQSDVLVGVGRGIEDEETLELAQSLAEALGADVCASRPIVDKGLLPKSRQVGTSGVSVSPRLYLAVGISGSFQHMGGIKGAPYLVAINKDPAAPIFAQASVGIVGDLEEVVPALEEVIRKAKT